MHCEMCVWRTAEQGGSGPLGALCVQAQTPKTGCRGERCLPACLLCPCVLTMLCCAVLCRVWPSLASSSVQPVCSREGAGQVRSGWERQGRAGQVVYLDATAAIPLVDRLASGVCSCLCVPNDAFDGCRLQARTHA